MDFPKVLINGEFKPEDLEVSVSESTRKIDPIIESQIEALWEAKKKEADDRGQICYNGLTYRLNSLNKREDKIELDFGTIDFKIRGSLGAIPEYFNLSEEFYHNGCFCCASVKTSDNLYCMVELSGKSMNTNTIDLIGGIMDADVELSNGYDVFQSLYIELEEEAGILEEDIEKSYLQTIYLTDRTNIAFYFEILLKIPSSELLERFKNNKDQDIRSLRVFTKQEYLEVLKNHKSLNKQFTAQLLQI